MITTVKAFVADRPAESATRSVKVEDPELAGVPVMLPVAEARVSPSGKLPSDTDHEYGGVPPAAEACAEYAAPVTPPGNAEAVIERAAGSTVSENERDAV